MLIEQKIYLLAILTSSFFICLMNKVGFVNILIYFMISFLGMSYINCYYYGKCYNGIYLFIGLYIFFNIIYLVFYQIFEVIIPKHSKVLLKQTTFKQNRKYINLLDEII